SQAEVDGDFLREDELSPTPALPHLAARQYSAHPLPRCGVAAPRLLRAARPAHRAGGARGAAGTDDYPPRLVRPLRPSPAAGAGDAAHLALRLGQRRPRVPPPLPLRSLSPL